MAAKIEDCIKTANGINVDPIRDSKNNCKKESSKEKGRK
jgi:hypothetical protein